MAPKYSICIFINWGTRYKEILGDDFQSIAAVPSNENNAILIGGRNEVRYSFQK
jgi:hypothetical protein